jgi:hypothetical protein
MSDVPTMMDLVGLWECGHCGQVTDVTHFYMDRATGEMQHEANAERRQKLADRCGWRFDYGDGFGVQRCVRPHWRREHSPELHGCGGFSETGWGAMPPYDPSTANGANA